ncbi:MAG: PilZ domain-containing protein [Acidobacteria bacterium]|nr:PilZ domain-containing protein [Acidobacteriota bacterium]
MSEDKRKYLRFDCTLPAEIINLEPGQELFKGAKIDDFSREGIKIILEFDVHPDTELDLNFRLPDSEKNVPVKAKVIWSTPKKMISMYTSRIIVSKLKKMEKRNILAKRNSVTIRRMTNIFVPKTKRLIFIINSKQKNG